MDLYLIAGRSGQTKSVIYYHTNKKLRNFDPFISRNIDLIYDGNTKPGVYTFQYGAQNGYNEIGYTVIEIVAHSSSGRTADSDSANYGSNPW